MYNPIFQKTLSLPLKFIVGRVYINRCLSHCIVQNMCLLYIQFTSYKNPRLVFTAATYLAII